MERDSRKTPEEAHALADALRVPRAARAAARDAAPPRAQNVSLFKELQDGTTVAPLGVPFRASPLTMTI